MLKLFLSFFIFVSVLYGDFELQLQSINFTTENDADFRQDNDYTYGSEVGFLFFIDTNTTATHYFSLSYAHKMYTPKDLEQEELIEDDRPYAGFEYLKFGYFHVNNQVLYSLTFQAGRIGPKTRMQKVQEFIHSLIGSPDPKGWKNQLGDENIYQINFSHKYYTPFLQKSVLIPEYGFDFGNASKKLYGGVLYRWGENIPKNFGSSMMENTNYPNIPFNRKQNIYKKSWNYSLNVWGRVNYIYEDIFLDGNTNAPSHSVEKYSFLGEIGYGVSLSYQNWSLDYLRKHKTKEFVTQSRYHNYGSLIFGYNY